MPPKQRAFLEFMSDLWDKVIGKNQPPWDENWALDDKFFKQMEAWERDHPESTFSKVLDNVNSAIMSCQPFLAHIPSSPFPAHSLVQGLAYLLQLGMTITSAKKDVYEFTMQVSTWFYAVEASFRAGPKKKFATQAKKNLNMIRDLINEICKWGWARVNDGRWASFVNGFTISGEIQAFKEKVTESRELLSTMQDVNVAMALDDILTEILTIKRFTKCQLGQILDYLKERDLMERRRRHLDETLNPEIALRRTAYDDQGKLPCDKDTRVDILTAITNWVNDVSSKSQHFFWLTGDPGCGKSAIAASLARYCKKEGTLWAQFFVNRNTEATTNPRVYFPSIARQMSKHSSDSTVSKAIYDILQENPTLLDGMSNEQALELFVQVVQVACDIKRSKPVVIVIDGLDETARKSLKDTATIFSGLFKKLQRPNAKVFISSRTDNEITKPFFLSLQKDHKYVKHVHLDTSDPSSMEDVSKYLSRKIRSIAEDRNLNLEIWPGPERFQTLCLRAAGLFIWAVTVVKFFEEQLRLYGHECLGDLLDAINSEGMEDVNKLYQTILNITYSSNARANQNAWVHETFRWVVGFITALREPLPIEAVGALLDLRRKSTSDPIDILHFTTNLRTVLVAGTDEITKDTIPRLHRSFTEFIMSDEADEQFRIDPGVVDVEIALKCLQLVRRLRNTEDRSRIPPASVRYAIRNWTRHLPNEGIASGVALFGEDENQTFTRIHNSIEAFRKSVMSVSGDYRTHIYDPQEGLPPPTPFSFSQTAAIDVGDGVWAMATSMDGRLIASGGLGGDICIWDSKSHGPIGKPLRGHFGRVRSLCFSPDSRWLVSGSGDRSVRVWDCQTGQATGSPFWGHAENVNSVCTDGHLIISGSYDETIRIWDLKTGMQTGSPIYTNAYVDSVALSSDGRIAADVGHSVCVWDLKTRDQIISMTGHTTTLRTLAFSPDNSRIASGDQDGSIILWDTENYQRIGGFNGHSGWVSSLAFSPDGRLIASGSNDKSIRVWNLKTGQVIDPPLRGHTHTVTSLSFSPDGHQVISGSQDKTVRIWSKLLSKEWPKPESEQFTTMIDLSQQAAAPSPHAISLEGGPSIISACYSPDRTLYASSTLDRHVSLWHIEHGLLWDSDAPIQPINLLRVYPDRLIISSPDGSVWAWDMVVDGKLAEKAPTTSSGPQLNNIHRFHQRSNSSQMASDINRVVRWIPFKIDAGSWAYVDGTIIRFESGGSLTFIDVGDVIQ